MTALDAIQCLSFMSALFFCSGMDSENIIVPTLGAIISFIIFGITYFIEKQEE